VRVGQRLHSGRQFRNSARVGKTLVESWNGARWSVVPTPNRGSAAGGGDGLGAVSCVPAGPCTAVGSYTPSSFEDKTLVESN
jgi:hypothetical protein